MVNTLKSQPRSSPTKGLFAYAVLFVYFVAMLALSNPVEGKETKYKKQTSVDFEEATIEGKSRKPYSSYLTQQKESAFSDLYEWSPDFEHAQTETQAWAERRQ